MTKSNPPIDASDSDWEDVWEDVPAEAAAPQVATPNLSGPESALLGAGNVLGMAKPLAYASAAVEKGVGKLGDLLLRDKDNQLYKDVPVSQLAQENRQMIDAAKEDHGLAMLGGEVVSSLALPAKMVPQAIIGAGRGAIEGYQGAAEGEKLSGTIQGGAIGGALGLAGAAAPALIKGGGRLVQTLAEKTATLKKDLLSAAAKNYRGMIGATGKAAKRAFGSADKADNAVELLKSTGFFKAGGSPSAMLDRAKELMRTTGEQLDGIYAQLDSLGTPAAHFDDLIDGFGNAPSLQKVAGKKAFDAVNNKINTVLDDITDMVGPATSRTDPNAWLSFNKLREIKQYIGSLAFEPNMDIPAAKKPLVEMYGIVDDMLTQAADGLPGLPADLKQVNQLHSAASKVTKTLSAKLEAAKPSLAGEKHRTVLGTLSQLAQAAGKAGFNPETMAQEIGPGTEAFLKMAPKITSMFGKFAGPLMTAAQKGPAALAAKHFILSQSQPEYQKVFQKAVEEGEWE